ncbi:MAG TPA: adenylate/guanylate cyclase domain-containing protein [Candidatus Limnocylindrales bacterium]|nr:adenylate/guanylate cyclase domain-containing protein [Candidatus Limnocylindrales bacterium]
MSGLDLKRFTEPDERVTFELGHTDLVTIGPLTVGREVEEPGWRWSTHVRPIAGTERCEYHHVGYQVSGRLMVETRDGEVKVINPGDLYDTAPGHDSWVVGDDPSVRIVFQGIADWAKAPDPRERLLATVLFTDIVGSTATAEHHGDRAWKRLLQAHHEDVRGLLEAHRGREIKMTGDGFLATFDSPGRAIAAALRIAASAHLLGIEIRAGIHTGEVELAGHDLRGLAVHIAARVMEGAGPGEVLVSATTRELASGGDFEFIDRGARDLKGVSGPRQIFEARSRPG